MRSLSASTAFLLVLSVCGPAMASVSLLPPASASASLQAFTQSNGNEDYYTVTKSGLYTAYQAGKMGDFASGSVSIVNSPVPTLSVSGSVGASLSESAIGEDASLTYSVEATGPTGYVMVDATIRGSAITHSSSSLPQPASNVASASVEIGTLYLENAASISGIPQSGGGGVYSNGTGQFDHTVSLEFQTGVAYDVTLSASVDLAADGSLTGSAFVDPYFAIDRSVPNADLYSIQVSQGLGNSIAGGVPESSTWVMMLLGFGGIGIIVCKKTRANTGAASIAA